MYFQFCSKLNFSTESLQQKIEEDVVRVVKEPLKHQIREKCIDELGRSYGIGRRKTSSAKVFLMAGSGLVTINGRSLIDYFQFHERVHALQPLELTENSGKFDIECIVSGGGMSGSFIS
jgi:small subunit ribosomal protein S9